MTRIIASSKAEGILIGDLGLAKHCVELVTTFVGIGNDGVWLSNADARLLKDFNDAKPTQPTAGVKLY